MCLLSLNKAKTPLLKFFPLLVCVGLYCKNPFNPQRGEGIGYYPFDTPERVIQNLELAYSVKDLEGYLECLDEDSFKFYFDPREDSIGDILRRYLGLDSLVWGYHYERFSTRELFNSVDEIYLNLYKRSIHIYNNGTRAYGIYDYVLFISPAPTGYDYAEGRAIFVFKKYPSTNIWKIIEWQDFAQR